MKKLFTLALITCSLGLSQVSNAQNSFYFLADNVKTGGSLANSVLTDVVSMGGGMSCAGCAVIPSSTTSTKVQPAKVVLNFAKNEQSILTLKMMMLKQAGALNAYIIFSKPSGTIKPATPASDYYYYKLTN